MTPTEKNALSLAGLCVGACVLQLGWRRRRKGRLTMATYDLNQSAEVLVQRALAAGHEQSFFFITAMKRYQVQLDILKGLEAQMQANGQSPRLIKEYNAAAAAANKTADTIMKILEGGCP